MQRNEVIEKYERMIEEKYKKEEEVEKIKRMEKIGEIGR